MKRIIAVLCLVAMLSLTLPFVAFAAWDGNAATEFSGGAGTVDDPFLISTPEQLALFRNKVNNGSSTICAKLIDNVDMNNIDWDPIGLSSGGYNGTFDGCGYAIRNLKISRISKGSSLGSMYLYGSGLFGIVGKSGVVKHVNVDGVISTDETVSNNPDIGAICGGNFGIIQECFSTVQIRDFNLKSTAGSSGHVNIGGICGVNAGTVKNCYAIGSFDINISSRAPVCIGGICGLVYTNGSVMKNCYSAVRVKADTTAENNIGGIFGCLDISQGDLSNLYTDSYYHSSLTGNGTDSYLSNSAVYGTAHMTSQEFVNQLGNAFQVDTEKKNLGYPILAVMVYEEENDSSDWFEDEINSSNVDKELFDQLTPSELRNRDLTQPITRAEFCAVSVKLYEEMGGIVYSATQLECPFEDASSDDITKAYKIGITNGISETQFNPYAKISRQDMSVMLTRVHKALNLEGWSLTNDEDYAFDRSSIRTFDDDAEISMYAKNSVYFMAYNNIIKGVNETGTIFAPRNTTSSHDAIGYANATREQAIILSIRMFNKFN